jgi:hypothetical protein
MGATNDQIQSVIDLASAEQKRGIIADEVQLAGAQQIATFLHQKKSLETLIPAINDLVAQQKGYDATVEDSRNIANLFGRVMEGSVFALRRVGISFTDAEEKVLKYGNEQQKAAMLAQVITNNVGRMNYTLAQTDVGRQKQLANTWDDVKETFGKAFTQIAILFIPILQVVVKGLSLAAYFARQFAQFLSEIFGGNQKNADVTKDQADNIGISVDNQDDLTDAVNATTKASKKLLANFDEINKLSSESADAAGAMDSTIPLPSTGGYVFGFGEKIEPPAWLSKMNINFDNLKRALSDLWNALKPLGKSAFEGLKWAYDNIFKPLAKFYIEDYLPRYFTSLATAVDIFNTILKVPEKYLLLGMIIF